MKSALENTKVLWSLIELARESRKSKSVKDNLASVLIYANLAEFLSVGILDAVISRIDSESFLKKCKINPKSFDESKSNLEAIVPKLKLFNFPNDFKIIPLILKVKDNRNKLFHNLLNMNQKNLNMNSLIRNIQVDTETLFKYWSAIYKDLLSI
ncbi:MAG: hypothetical protein WAV41_00195 [Microgenomates group bacterium]